MVSVGTGTLPKRLGTLPLVELVQEEKGPGWIQWVGRRWMREGRVRGRWESWRMPWKLLGRLAGYEWVSFVVSGLPW